MIKLQPSVKLQPVPRRPSKPLNEQTLAEGWAPVGFSPSAGRDIDYETADGRTVIEVKLGAQGIRDLHGALIQLALYLDRNRSVERAVLVMRFPRMSLETARKAWESARNLLAPAIGNRLGVVLLLPGEPRMWFDPEDGAMAAIARSIADSPVAPSLSPTDASIPTSKKFFETWKVLLRAWLKREKPLTGRRLAEVADCSYPMVLRFIDFLRRRNELKGPGDTSSLELRSFPRTTFEQAVGLSDGLRRTEWFADTSGRAPDPDALLRRLQKMRPKGVGVGGVAAARTIDPSFDLHGTPRLDLTYWVPSKAPGSLAFVTSLDPALWPSTTKDGAVLAVHRLTRAEPLFETGESLWSVADPVEILLDLHELRLGAQANALVKHLRGES